MKALFRCDVTRSGGAGHLVRSIALAERARSRGFEPAFCGNFETPFAKSLLVQNDFPVISFSGDSRDLADLASAHGASVVHCDDYKIGDDLHKALALRDISLSIMEDGNYGSRSADLIIDPSPAAEQEYRHDAPSATHLRGLHYVPLRQTVADAAQKRRMRMETERKFAIDKFCVLVMLGGTDAAGATEEMVDLWVQSVPETLCMAVLPGLDVVRVELRGQSEIHWLPPSQGVAELFAQVDGVITAAGTTVWEVSAIGVPAAVIQQAENQSLNYHYATRHGAMLGLGTVQQMVEEKVRVADTLKELAKTREGQPSLSDTLGADRIVREWTDSLGKEGVLRLRQARLSDASNLFEWRNDVDVRAVSKNREELHWDDHIQWLRATLNNPRRRLLVAVMGFKPVGTVRFDQDQEALEQWEISLTLAPGCRGQGLGTTLLRESENWLSTWISSAAKVVAYVKTDNHASTALFSKGGYVRSMNFRSGEFSCWQRRLKA